MTKQEIIEKISANIEGQGTNIDAGSALPSILKGIIDLLPDDQPTPSGILAEISVTTLLDAETLVQRSGSGLTKAGACQALGISTGDLDNLLSGKIVRFFYQGGSLAVGSQTTTSVFVGDSAGLSILIVYDSNSGEYSVTAANTYTI